MSEVSFYSGERQPSVSAIIVTGAARSGKTLVGNLLGSCQSVEHLDEPWLLMMLPILAGQEVLPEPFAIQMFRTYAAELWNDRILMRHVSFRPTDLSSIWRQKTPQEILTRLIGLSSRDDVKRYVSERRPTLVFTLTDTLPFCEFFWKALSGCRVVHVVREGLEVARAVAEKHWLSDEEFLHPRHASPYRAYPRPGQGIRYHLPWWVKEGDEERFLQLCEYARGVYYWCHLTGMRPPSSGPVAQAGSFRVLRLADVLAQPRETIGRLVEWSGVVPTEMTSAMLAHVTNQRDEVPPELIECLDQGELRAVRTLYRQFDFSTHALDGVGLHSRGASLKPVA